MKFIEVHAVGFENRRIYINPANIMAVGENEQHEGMIFYNTVRSPEHVIENYDSIKMKIIDALED